MKLRRKHSPLLSVAEKVFVGIHASADCEYDWKWYGELNGAFFKTHPPYQLATINIESINHPAYETLCWNEKIYY